MQRIHFIFLLILGSLLARATALTAQVALPAERVHLLVSEPVIGAGETLWFQGTLWGEEPRSTVLYVEVLSRAGAVVQGIFAIEDSVAQGQLRLPDTLSGGWYQVRAYTQWMRNAGPAAFATYPLLVVNPYEDQLQPTAQSSTQRGTGEPQAEKVVQVSLGKARYQAREPMTVRWQLTDASPPARVAVCVRKVNPVEYDRRRTLSSTAAQTPTDSLRYVREDEGLVISGTVTGMTPSTADRTVILSIPGTDPYFEYDFVDQQNRFEIPINRRRQGKQEVILQTADTTLDTRWSIDDKFARENTYDQEVFPEVPAAVLAELLAAYTQRSRINAQYDLYRTADSATGPVRTDGRFYGAPNFTVRSDDYVALPNFVEVSRELMPGIRLRDRQGTYHFDVFDIPTRNFLEGEPAVFMDGVLIRNVNYLVNFPPRDIERIETVNRRTYYGEYRFDGVIAVYSRTGDAYGPALPTTARREPVTLYTAPRAFARPDSLTVHEPDFRRLLYWQPSMELSEGVREITVVNADELGTFEVIVAGVTSQGEQVFGRATYTVEVNQSAGVRK